MKFEKFIETACKDPEFKEEWDKLHQINMDKEKAIKYVQNKITDLEDDFSHEQNVELDEFKALRISWRITDWKTVLEVLNGKEDFHNNSKDFIYDQISVLEEDLATETDKARKEYIKYDLDNLNNVLDCLNNVTSMQEPLKVKDFELYLNDECELVGCSKPGFIKKLRQEYEATKDDTDYYLYDREHNQFVRFYKDGTIKVDAFDDNKANEKALSILRCTHYDLLDTDVLK